MEHIDGGEVLGKAFPEPGRDASFQKSVVGSKTHNAAVPDAVGGPADCLDIGIVENFILVPSENLA